MANLKLSELTQRTSVDGTEYTEVIISPFTPGTNRKVLLSNLNNFRGDWAGTTSLPTIGGTYISGAPAAGNEWRLSNELNIDGNTYAAGTIIKAMINTPGQTLSNWAFISVQL